MDKLSLLTVRDGTQVVFAKKKGAKPYIRLYRDKEEPVSPMLRSAKKTAIPATLLLSTLLLATPAPAEDLGKEVGKSIFEPTTRDAIPGDKEEMNDRELRIRRNMETNGTPYGTGEPASNQHMPPTQPPQPKQPMPKTYPATGPRG